VNDNDIFYQQYCHKAI